MFVFESLPSEGLRNNIKDVVIRDYDSFLSDNGNNLGLPIIPNNPK